MKLLRSFNPCYDPIKYLPENWQGTAIDILQHDSISHSDKMWAVLRPEILSDKVLRLFAISCARSCIQYATKESQGILEQTIEVAYKFAHGQATEEERSAAWSAAWSAAKSAESAAWSAESAAQKNQIKNLVQLIELLDDTERHE
jgi:hypothetical protein